MSCEITAEDCTGAIGESRWQKVWKYIRSQRARPRSRTSPASGPVWRGKVSMGRLDGGGRKKDGP